MKTDEPGNLDEGPGAWIEESEENLNAAEFFKEVQAQHIRNMQERGVTFLFRAYGFLILATMTIIFLQGFHAWGFALDPDFLWWLGIAVLGEVSGLAALVYGFFFRR